jgi:ribosomal protein S18 acetylase RimI-like enzyme
LRADRPYREQDDRHQQVAKPWRGLGVGTRLLSALHNEARASGIARLSLSVETANRALRLYQRVGYRELTRDNDAATMVVELER